MDSSDPRVARTHPEGITTYAVGGIVRGLCSIRGVALALAAADALLQRGSGAPVLVAVAAAPFSFVPALRWNTRAQIYFRNGVLLSADLVVAVGVLIVVGAVPLMAAYGAATLALWGATTGMRITSLLAVPVLLLVVPWTNFVDGWRSVVGGLVTIVAVLGMAWMGKYLGDNARSNQRVVSDLAIERSQRAVAEERLRIARDLHDTVAGELAGIHLLAHAMCARTAAGEASTVMSDLACDLEQLTASAHRHTRLVLDELRTSSGLRAEVGSMVGMWAARTQIVPQIRWGGPSGSVSNRTVLDVRAVLGELLENVRKHAGATRVLVEVVAADAGREVVLTVDDDGLGMAPRESAGGHYGMRGIVERANAGGGTAAWSASKLGGTCANVVLRDPARPGALTGIDDGTE